MDRDERQRLICKQSLSLSHQSERRNALILLCTWCCTAEEVDEEISKSDKKVTKVRTNRSITQIVSFKKGAQL